MLGKINQARKKLRYKRTDIDVFICLGKNKFVHVKLINISQEGMLIRSPLNLKPQKYIRTLVSLDKDNEFEQKSRIVSKLKRKEVATEPFKKIWSFLARDSWVYDYGIVFEDDDSDFKVFLLQSNIKQRLEYHNS